MSVSHRTLSNGIEIIIKRQYTPQESSGVIVLVVTSFISLSAVILLLCAIAVSAFKAKGTFNKHIFLRTHVAGYFFSLMVCYILQDIASIMNTRWIHRGGLEAGGFCTSQGALKHFSDVGMALWTLVVAVHSFCLLFWEMEGLSVFNLWATLVGGWFAIGAIVISGPATLDLGKMGPYYSISGYWCWISPQYKTQQIVLGWLMLLFAAVFSLILYPLIFLRLRGNIIKSGWRIKFTSTRTAEEDIKKWRGLTTDHSIRVAKQMLLYPVTYTLLILPIVISRLSESSHKKVTLGGMIFSDTVYQLSGLVTAVLLIATRPVLSSDTILFKGWNISWPFERGGGDSESESEVSASNTNTDSILRHHVNATPPPQYPTLNITKSNKSLSIKSGPSWTQREIKQPPEIIIRDSIGSIYSIYDEHPNHEFEPPQPHSSQWSPDTPPKSGKR